MYYALTVNNYIITGVHESLSEFTADTFALNPELAGHEVIPIGEGTQYQSGIDIRAYSEDGVIEDLVWAIEQGYVPMPDGYDIIDGELVELDLPAEEAPPTMMAVMREAAEEAARDATNAFDKRFTALKPIISDLLKDREAAVVIGLKDFILDWKPGPHERGHSVMRNNYPFKVVQTHDSTEQPNWTPEEYQAGFAPWHGTTPETALPWMMPRHAEENYLPGEYMIWDDGKIYLSQRSTNFTPEEHPDDWHVQQADGTFTAIDNGEVVDPEEPEEPEDLNSNGTIVWSEWQPWTSGLNSDLYQIGDRTTKDNVRYIATLGNNHYDPASGTGWEVVIE